ncbi:MAG: DNA adenine methylase [Candidatus Heimdallarchaeota archaeon]
MIELLIVWAKEVFDLNKGEYSTLELVNRKKPNEALHDSIFLRSGENHYPVIHPSVFPPTRYQGSKYKLINWFLTIYKKYKFKTVLDAFGGTGVVSYMFKRMKKEVTYNDLLISNYFIGKALIENRGITFDVSDVGDIFKSQINHEYKTIIQDNFRDIYYTDEENRQLDICVQNIIESMGEYKKALCFFALFQACLQKRPFNLFHRKNLYLRQKDVNRSFGNKKTWDTPFEQLFIKALKQANKAIFDNNQNNQAVNCPVHDLLLPEEGFDLIYLDPPYISHSGVGINYRDFYHFLEGICNYHHWLEMIDFQSKHKRLKVQKNGWVNKNRVEREFESVVAKFQDSIISISYRDPGIPSISTIQDIVSTYKNVVDIYTKDYCYALTSRKNRGREVLIIGR